MKKIIFITVLFVISLVGNMKAETISKQFSVSFNLIGYLLGNYGISGEVFVLDWLSLEGGGYYSFYKGNGISGGNIELSLTHLEISARFYPVSWVWLSVGGGLNIASIQDSLLGNINGNVPFIILKIGFHIDFEDFFVEPYGGFASGLGIIDGIERYGGYERIKDIRIYGANIGIRF